MSQLAKNSKNTKDTIYIDPEDEITSIIDKLEASNNKIVALVLPKRSTALQSTVNMRLLKRSADNAKKRLVLITNEPGLLPLAGAIGLYTAKNLQSKPSIPPAPKNDNSISEVSAEDVPAQPTDEPAIDESKSVGELSGDEPDSIELDNSDGKAETASTTIKVKKEKRLKIPDYDRFRLLIIGGVAGAILLVVFLLYAFVFAPKANIVIKADSVPASATLSVQTSANIQSADTEKQILPVELKELKQTSTETVPATGQKDLGSRASGTVRLINCDEQDDTITVSSGTFVSNGGKNYVTQAAVTIGPSNFTGGGACKRDSYKDVKVVAQNPGEQYNIAADNEFAVSGTGGSVEGENPAAISGGTTKIAKVVSQADVDAAKQKITPKLQTEQQNFQKTLEDQGYLLFDETATTTEPKITANPGIDQEATQTTVTWEQTYSVMVTKKSELEKLLLAELNKQIDTKTQKIDDSNLLDGAIIRVTEKKSPTEATISVEKTANATAIFDEEAIKAEVKGKKRGDIQDNLSKRPGVKDVTVTYSPFWVTTTPKAAKKITIVIEPVSENGSN